VSYDLIGASKLSSVRYMLRPVSYDRIERTERHRVELFNHGILIKSLACDGETSARAVANIAAAIMIRREDGWEERPGRAQHKPRYGRRLL
jgi:hypothetical protein